MEALQILDYIWMLKSKISKLLIPLDYNTYSIKKLEMP